MIQTIGNYLNTNYTYKLGSRTVTMYPVPFKMDTTVMKKVELIRPNMINDSSVDTLLRAFSILYGDVQQAVPDASVTGTPDVSTRGYVDFGNHYYRTSYLVNGYESALSASSNVVTCTSTYNLVNVTGIPLGPTATTARNIYRTRANASVYYLVTQLTDNTTTTYVDLYRDASITTTAPSTATVCYDFTWSPSMNGISTPTTQSADAFNIEFDVLDPAKVYDLGYDSVAEINPAKYEFDTVFNVVTTQAFTTGWVVAGSAFSMEGRNVAKCYCLFTVGGLTSARFRALARHTTGGTAWPLDIIFDDPNRATEVHDAANSYYTVYQLNECATQYFTFEVITDLAVSEIEIQILGVGTMTSSAFTMDVIKSYSTTRPTDNKMRDYDPKIIGAGTNVSASTYYYPDVIGEMIMGVANISLQLEASGGVTTTFQVSDNASTYYDCTQMGVVSGDNTAVSRVRQTSFASFVNPLLKLDFDNINSKYFRVKSVTSTSTNTFTYYLKKRSF